MNQTQLKLIGITKKNQSQLIGLEEIAKGKIIPARTDTTNGSMMRFLFLFIYSCSSSPHPPPSPSPELLFGEYPFLHEQSPLTF
jgi:hypothetical protein